MNLILFEPEEVAADGRVVFGGARAAHAIDFLHAAPGRTLKTGVVDGPLGVSVVEAVAGEGEGRTVAVRARHDRASLAPWCDLLLAMPRPRVFKRLLPQLASMGAGRIVLVGAEKVEKCYWSADCLKPAAVRAALVEGLMQAGTSALPEVRAEKSLARYLADGFEADFAGQARRYLAHPDARAAAPALRGGAGRAVVAVGPEGGWTDAELAALEARGFARVSLGPRVLRTETAAVALLAVVGAREAGL